MKKIFLLLLFCSQLSAFDWSLSTEASLFLADFDGSIKNYKSDVNYRAESNGTSGLNYNKSALSYFESELRTTKWYIPTVSISYMSIVETQNSDLNETHLISVDFNSSVTTKTSYEVINFKMFKSFFKKGDRFKVGGKKFYPGDLELDLGFNVKRMVYRFELVDKSLGDSAQLNYIDVKQFIALPYVGVRYYFYNLILYANVSALGLSRVQASNYIYGAEYRVYKKIYMGIAYMDESFKAVEKEDTVTFSSTGTKLSVKYIF